MLDAIPDQHYAQFPNDISHRLLQKVCSLASLFVSPRPVHIYQKIGMVILDYLRDLRSDGFGGAHQLAQAFQKWHLLVEPLPSVAAPIAAPVAVSAPILQTPAQQEHQKKVDLMMKMHEKRESKVEHQKWVREVEEGRKRIRDWQEQRRSEEASEREGQPMQVQMEVAAAASGSTLQNVVEQPSDSSEPVHIKIPKLWTEEEQADHITNIALNFPPTPNLEFKVSNLSHITKPELEQLPQNPKFWTKCIEMVCKLVGMMEWQASTFGVRIVETACQMMGVEMAESSVPQVLHPIVGDAPVETGREDPRALWVILMDTWKDFGPMPWMRHAFWYMLTFTASNADFRLHSMEECILVVQLFNQSLDIREDPAFSLLLHMLFCFFGTDVLQPANLKGTMRRVKNIAGLLRALNDIEKNAASLVSLRCPSDICASKDAENEVQYIFAIDFQYWRVSTNYCLGLKAADMNEMTNKCWANLTATLHNAFAMVPHNKMGYQFLAQIILTAHQFGTYMFDMLDISLDERVLNLVPSVEDELKERDITLVLQLEMRPRSPPWQ